MKDKKNLIRLVPLICTILFTGFVNAQEQNPCKTGGRTCYFGIEMNDILYGYSIESYCEEIINGKRIRYEYSDVTLKMSLLGADIDAGFTSKYSVDPLTQRTVGIEMVIRNGNSVIKTISRITGDTIYFSIPASGLRKNIPVDNKVILTSQTWYPHLYNDFVKKGAEKKKYTVFDPIKGELTEKEYIIKSDERIVLADSAFQTRVFEETDLATGIKTLLWINKADGFNVKAVVAGRTIYLADKSVSSRITFASMDDELFARTDKKVTDIMNLLWLSVKARVNSYGEELTPQSLNSRGQKFSGTVTGSLIEGIFEMEPVRYTGENAPSFPPDFGKVPDLNKYLKPELLIESDDPLIMSEAARITYGSKDSWEASVRLGRWVAENISGALPGGISAINTLRSGEAECGGHSRLMAAFCRSVGIPARVIIGCMYTTYYSGSFGQHAWTEVFMGNDGWIPVDATINEFDYIDAGHIRLGEVATFRPVSMEILNYRSKSNNTADIIPDDLRTLPGSYMNIEQYRMFRIIIRNGGLAIDIPGRAVLDLNPPDNMGKLYPRLTREISLTPSDITEAGAGNVLIQQYFRLSKISSPDTTRQGLPEEFRKLAGNYQFRPAGLTLDVTFSDSVLVTRDPSDRSEEKKEYSKRGDTWTDKTGTYEIGFLTNNSKEITGMSLTVKTMFIRGEPVTNIVEPVIKESGVEAGIKKYDEIKRSGNTYYLFSEQMLHQTGHNLLKENRIDDAIIIFNKNVREYPDSFIANDALAETYMKKGENKLAIRYFKMAVKLNPEYSYGREMIKKLRNK